MAKYHSNLFGDDVRLLNALKIKMALSCKGCPTAKEPFIMLEEELAKTLRPNPVNLDKAYSQYDQTSFDQWQKVASIQQEMEIKLQTKLSRRLHL